MSRIKRPRNQAIKEELDPGNSNSNDNHHLEPKKSIKTEDYLKCELCDQVCSSVSQLQSHTLSEHVPKRKPSSSSAPPQPIQRVSCQQCDDTFENFAQFALHMKTHIGNSNVVYYCPMCPMGNPFRDKKSQLEHIVSQHIQMQMIHFVCNECENSFTSPSLLSQHFWQSHVKQKFFCSQCDFVCDNEKAFKEHSKSHSHQIVMFGCTLCGSAFQGQQELVNHVQVSHDQDTFYPPALFAKPSTTPSPKPVKPRPLQCSVCDETVFGEDGLDEHRLVRHCKVRYADNCADCREPITSETNFVEHCLRHAQDHAHHCPVCRQSLRSDSQIHAHCTYHMKKEDPAEIEEKKEEDVNNFSFVCPVCGESAEDGIALLEHCKKHN